MNVTQEVHKLHFYICHLHKKWNPAEPCVLFASRYEDYEQGDVLEPNSAVPDSAAPEEPMEITVISYIETEAALDALAAGVVCYMYKYARSDIEDKQRRGLLHVSDVSRR